MQIQAKISMHSAIAKKKMELAFSRLSSETLFTEVGVATELEQRCQETMDKAEEPWMY